MIKKTLDKRLPYMVTFIIGFVEGKHLKSYAFMIVSILFSFVFVMFQDFLIKKGKEIWLEIKAKN